MRIGLPRALIYYYYYPLWKSFFEQLGMEVVVSDISTKQLVGNGTKVTVAEICLPIKIFNGHVINLLSKNVDYIFVPRFVSVEKDKWFCPKFIGLPELASYNVEGARAKLLTIDIDSKREDTCDVKSYKALCGKLNVSVQDIRQALKRASARWQQFRECCKKGFTIEEAHQICYEGKKPEDFMQDNQYDLTLGLLGYVYNIYDPFTSMDIIKKLRSMGVKIVTFEMMNEKEIANRFGKKSKSLYWTFTNKLYGTAATFMNDAEVDGLIHVTAFGCGPDSIMGKLLELDSDQYKKPFMTLRVDEHTGESHLQTRIEAFVDMLKRKKYVQQRRELA